jgi:hypothetical protein
MEISDLSDLSAEIGDQILYRSQSIAFNHKFRDFTTFKTAEN